MITNYLDEAEFGYDIAAEPETVMQVNRELDLARRIVDETAANLFLTGKAGTGKTTFLRRLRETSKKRMVVLAPTGVAAINAGGMTLHSFFQLPFSAFIPGRGFIGEEKRFYRIGKEKRRLIASLDLMVIDEVSMVRPDTLDGIDRLLRRLRGIDRPFGGIQLLLIGDLRQLAPVVRPDEWNMLRDFYASPYFFESHALREAGFLTVELKTIYRQQDPEFIALLNAVRDGNVDRNVMSQLNRLCRPADEMERDLTILLTTHNRIADDTNTRRLAMLSGDAVTFEAQIKGKFPETSFPADRYLTLRVGARVMFIKNDSGADRRFYNGLIGTVTGLDEEKVYVLPDDDNYDAIEVGYVEWENTSYRIDEETKEISSSIDGVFSQIPLRLAWAITIHKSQGLTFDRAVIDASQSFAPGQLYVALSRCRTLAGMRLETTLPQSAVIIDRDVNSFIETSRHNSPDEQKLSELRDEYFRTLLAELFNFHSLAVSFADFSRSVLEYVAPIYPELFNSYREAQKRISTNVEAVGARFINLYASARIDADAAARNEALMAKIRNGCLYFLEQLAPVCNLLNETPMELDNAAYEQRLLGAADILGFEMRIKKHLLKGLLQEDFSPATYLRLKAFAVLADSETKTAAAKPRRRKKPEAAKTETDASTTAAGKKKSAKRKEPKEKKPKGYSQRVTLQMFRDGHSIEQIAEARNLAQTTITSHLCDMIALHELSVSDVVPPKELQKLTDVLNTLTAEKQEITYDAISQRVPDVNRNFVSVFYKYR